MRLATHVLVASLGVFLISSVTNGGTIVLENTGSSTGTNLDETVPGDVPKTVDVEEITGLQVTVTALAGTGGSGPKINSLATSLGIDIVGDGGDDTDQFDAAFSESTTWRFNKPVNITQLDFVTFDDTEVFSFAGTTINFGDLTNTTSDIFDFPVGGLDIPANTAFSLTATAGTIGIEAITLTVVVPEPRAFVLAAGSLVAFFLLAFRRRKHTRP